MDKNKKLAIVFAIIGLIIVVIGLLLINGQPKKEEKKEDIIEKVGASEEDIVNAYNMSKEDAINIVKTLYNGETYDYSVTINEDSKYIVTVKNSITEGLTKYLVDPTKNGSFYEIDVK